MAILEKLQDRLLVGISIAGFHNVVLWAFADNQRARAFYEAKGFVPTDKVELSPWHNANSLWKRFWKERNYMQ